MKKNKKRIIFIGGLTFGKKAINYLISLKNICLNLIFTQKKINIPRYESFEEYSEVTKIIKTKNVNNYYSVIKT